MDLHYTIIYKYEGKPVPINHILLVIDAFTSILFSTILMILLRSEYNYFVNLDTANLSMYGFNNNERC